MKKENYLFEKNNFLFIKKILKHTLILFITLSSVSAVMGQVAINEDNSNANEKAALDIKSVTKGVLFPSMSNASRDALKSPAAGLLIYNAETHVHNYFNGTEWKAITKGIGMSVTTNTGPGTEVGVGVGIEDPHNSALLHISSSTKGFLLPQGNVLPEKYVGSLFYTKGDNLIRLYNNESIFRGVTSTSIGTTTGTGDEVAEGVLIGEGSIANSAAMEVRDASRGLLIPRMNTTQRNAIESPAEGLTIYNTSTRDIEFYSASYWYAWELESVVEAPLVDAAHSVNGTGKVGAIQQWVVPAGVEVIVIEAVGAVGGTAFGNTGGLGAKMKGNFTVTPGDIIQIAVGQQGLPDGAGAGGGGGGGSFVYNLTTATLLMVAGGGGGAGQVGDGANASLSQNGGTVVTSLGGTNGNGGNIGSGTQSGGAGGGFLTDGAFGGSVDAGGKSWSNGLTGGTAVSSYGEDGGFGAGGAGNFAGGGGGGYSGGGSYFAAVWSTSYGGGGGGSYNVGVSQSNQAIQGVGDGQVIISY